MEEKKNPLLKIIIIALFVISAFASILFDYGIIKISSDYYLNLLISSIIVRFLYSLLGIIFIVKYRTASLRLSFKNIQFFFICLLVSIVNFPISALISGDLEIVRINLLPLYLIYTLLIALSEDLIFVGIIYPLVGDMVKRKNKSDILSIIITGLLFSFFHFLGGALSLNFGGGLYQALYTLLVGMMLVTIYIFTSNIYLPVITHMVFDTGGLFTDIIADGNPHDTTYWILMITASLIVFVYVLLKVLKKEREEKEIKA